MENNGNENVNSHDLPNHLEELLIHKRLANFVRNKIGKNLFLQWNDRRLCRIEKSDGRNVMLFLMLNGANEEENREKLDEILDAFKEAEDRFLECNECERFDVQFKLIHRMLIPEQKCCFLIGTGGESIRKLREDCNLLKAYIENGQREPLPEGYGRLIMMSDNVEGLRQARSEVCHLLRIASLDYNPRGLANGNGKRLLDGDDGNVQEKVKFAAADLNQKQREKWQQILEESRIEFITISDDLIELRGTPEKVLEVKDQLTSALNGMVQFETPQKWEFAEILVPFPKFRYVLGQNGDTIKAMQAKFDVRLIFQGENHEEYLNGRWLKIKGPNKEKVEEAKAHIEANYCTENEENGNGNGNWPKYEIGDDKPAAEVQKEMTLPKEVARKVLKMKIQNELNDYEIRRGLGDGNQRVVLIKGTRTQVEAAEAKLEKYCQKLAKNDGNQPKEEESSKSGSELNEGGKPKKCWIIPGLGEEKENVGPEILMNEEKEEKKKFIWSKYLGNEKLPEEAKKTLDVSIYDIDDNDENEELEEKEGGKGTSSQTMLEMLLAKMDEMKEIMEKALKEMKKEEFKKNEAHRRLEKRIRRLEKQILASKFQQNGKEE